MPQKFHNSRIDNILLVIISAGLFLSIDESAPSIQLVYEHKQQFNWTILQSIIVKLFAIIYSPTMLSLNHHEMFVIATILLYCTFMFTMSWLKFW